MKTISHTVLDPNGIHARPAGIIVNTAKKFSSAITISSGDKSCDCKRIFSVMGLSLKAGDNFSIEIIGEDEAEAAEALTEAIRTAGL